ncbi:ATP-binding protein [Pelagicoccus sp. SDUM812005]|uniref:hybrid sensor histidine kinase/response regulator n=1 Tax=Pelagicoccus sp. SDUM812005 TaxID=3041257 RepID=UPI00280E92B5|nr:ATP-binding protein [Pelagicoccus sp. SDUM812005]MDQ8183525.1 ATP-binding protein [Pelagicoccus sp. SDUM812005]
MHHSRQFLAGSLAIILFELLAVALISATAAAQESYVPSVPDPIREPWRWRQFSYLQNVGLRDGTEDSQGRIWFAEDHGVIVYDGLDWKKYGTQDGLSGVPVNAIKATSDGHLYAASDQGIDQFDGEGWQKVFPLGSDIPCPVNSFTESASGGIWAATAWGALRLAEGQEPTLYCSELAYAALKRLLPGLNARIVPSTGLARETWASSLGLRAFWGESLGATRGNQSYLVWATHPGGPAEAVGIQAGDLIRDQRAVQINFIDVVFAEPGTRVDVALTPFDSPVAQTQLSLVTENLPGGVDTFAISQILETTDGDLWFAHQSGPLSRYQPNLGDLGDPAAWTLFTNEQGLRVGRSPRLLEADDGTIWNISNDRAAGGVNRYRNGSWSHFRLESLPNGSDNSTSIIQTQDGTIMIGGFKLHVFKDETWSVYTVRDVPMPFHRTRLLETRNGQIWIIGLGEEASLLDWGNERWSSYERLYFECEDSQGRTWFIEQDGSAVAHKDGNWTRYDLRDIGIEQTRRIAPSRSGALWATGATEQKLAIARFDEAKEQWELLHQSSLTLDSPRHNAFFEAADGSLWFGSRIGVVHYDGERWHSYKQPNTPYQVYAITQTSDGSMWFGGNHLRRLTDGRWESVNEPIELASWIEAMTVDSHGDLWIGTRSYGLFRREGERFVRYGVEDGLASNSISSLQALDNGGLIARTQKGFSRFDGRDWAPRILPLNTSGQQKDTNFALNEAGYLWFNQDEQIAIRYKTDSDAPDCWIESAPEKIAPPGNVTLSWDGLDRWENTPADKLQFSWRIDGGPWSRYSTDKSVTLLELDTGEHTFELRARDWDFNVDSTPALTTLTVIPPIWRQGWFLSMLALFLGIIVIQASRILNRDKRLREASHTLETRVQERTRQLAEAKERAEVASKAKSDFLAVLSHEIRTPLNAILGFAQLIPLEDDKENRKQYITNIRDSGEHLLDLMDNILAYTNINNESPSIAPVSITQLLSEIHESFNRQATKRGLALSLQLPPAPVPRFLTDDARLRQALANLISNAIKFTEAGEIRTVLSVEESDSGANLRAVTIQITDTGIGMSPADVERIYEPFKQADSSYSRRFEGVGLGLSIVKRIVDSLGGSLSCSSQPDRGTQFTIALELPVVQESEPPPPPQDQPPPASIHAPILVVEDDTNNQLVIGSMLDRFGLAYEIADHGSEALDFLRAKDYSLALLDIHLPGIDGFEVARSIRDGACGEGKKELCLIGLSALETLEDRNKALAAGMNDFISKPVKLQTLNDTLSRYLSVPQQ